MAHRSWGAHCSGTIKTLVRADGVKLPVRVEILELVRLLCDETERLGYNLKAGWCWGYACRKIRGSSSWSNHAWGLAVDLNAPENPMGPRTGKIRRYPKVIALWKSFGFRWGGDYSGRADDMHFEFMGSVTDAKAQTQRALRELGGQQSEGPAPSPSRKGLTAGNLKWLAERAGLKGEDVTIAAAVALAESRLPGSINPPLSDPRAFNGKAPDASDGIWQINMHGKLGPDRRAKYGLRSNDDLFDPFTNARAMADILRSQGWQAWGAYKNGSYAPHLLLAQSAKPEPIGDIEPPLRLEEDVYHKIRTASGAEGLYGAVLVNGLPHKVGFADGAFLDELGTAGLVAPEPDATVSKEFFDKIPTIAILP